MKNIIDRGLAFLVLAVAGNLGLAGADPLTKYWEPVRGASIRMDATQPWVMEGGSYKGGGLRVTDRFNLNFVRDAEGYSVVYLYQVSQVTYRFSPQGRLRSMESLLTDPGLIDVAKMDRQTVVAKEQTLQMRTFLAGATTSEKALSYPATALYFDVIPYTLLLLLQQGTSHAFNADVIVNNSDTYNADFRLITTGQPLKLAGKYQYPSSLVDQLKPGESTAYVVFEMSMTGLVGMVYPHKWYWAFRNNADKSYVAMWGGDPASPQFLWRTK